MYCSSSPGSAQWQQYEKYWTVPSFSLEGVIVILFLFRVRRTLLILEAPYAFVFSCWSWPLLELINERLSLQAKLRSSLRDCWTGSLVGSRPFHTFQWKKLLRVCDGSWRSSCTFRITSLSFPLRPRQFIILWGDWYSFESIPSRRCGVAVRSL